MNVDYAVGVSLQRSEDASQNTPGSGAVLLTKVTLKNIRRYAGQQTIEFQPSEGSRSVHLVSAYNGSGKTTLFEAINACLFASKTDPILTAKDFTTTASQPYTTEMAVEVEFQHESQTYVLSRQWRRRSGYSDYSINSVMLQSLLQNRDSNDSSTDEDEITEFMNSLIPYQTKRLFLFDGEQVQTYIDEASDSVKDAIERLLGLHLYIQLHDDVRRLEQNLHQERRSHDVGEDLLAKQDAEEKNEAQVRSIERRRQELRRSAAEAKADYGRLQIDETRLLGLFDPVMQASRRDLESQRDTLMSDVERHENALAELIPNELVTSWFWSEISEAMSQQSVGISEFPKTIEELTHYLSTNKDSMIKALQSESTDNLRQAVQESLGGEGEDSVGGRIREGLQHLSNMIHLAGDKLAFHPEQLQFARATLDRITHELGSLPSAESVNVDVEKLHDEMEGLRSAQARHEESLKALSHERDRLNLESEDLKKDIGRLTEDKQKYRALSDTMEMCRQIRDVLDVFVNDYRSTLIGQLQAIVNKKYREYTNTPGLIETVVIGRDNFELKLLASESELLAEDQSAGQKEVLAFALIASVIELSNLQVPAIIDTPLARLDLLHRRNILRRFFPYLGPQVIVLATDSEVGRDEVNQLSAVLASKHHLHLDLDTGCTTIRSGYLDEQAPRQGQNIYPR